MRYPDGSLLRGSGADIFLVQGGARRPVPTDVFAASGFRMDTVQIISDADLAAIPLGAAVALPAMDGTVLENARAYAAHHKGSVAQMIAGLREAKRQEHGGIRAAKAADGERRNRAARDAAAANRAAAESDLQEAKDGQAKLRQRQGEYQSLVASHHLTILSHTSQLKLQRAKWAFYYAEPAPIFFGVPTEVCQEITDVALARGYQVPYVSAFNKHGATYYNIICRREIPQDIGGMYPVAEAQAKGLLAGWASGATPVTRIDSYIADGQVVYGLFRDMINRSYDWAAYLDVPLQETQGRIAALLGQGYGIVSQSYIQRPDGSVTAAAVFNKQQAGVTAYAQLATGAEYQRLLGEYGGRQMLPIDLSVATISGEPRFSAVWAPAVYEAYVARQDLDAQALHAEQAQCLAQGMLPVILVGYSNGDRVHYAALWVRYPMPAPPPAAREPSPPANLRRGRGKLRRDDS